MTYSNVNQLSGAPQPWEDK